MNQYKRLTVNTMILMIGTLGSRIITFFMLPFYTNILSTAEYGTVDLLLQISNFLVPVCTVGVTVGIIRFGLDNQYNKKDVFTTGLLCLGAGCSLCLIFAMIAKILPLPAHIGQYSIWIFIFISMSSLLAICGAFIRSQEKVRTYAFIGVFNTVCTVLLMILFLKVLHLGVGGYMLAVTLSDTITVLFLIFSSKLWQFVSLKNLCISHHKGNTEVFSSHYPRFDWLVDYRYV